MPGFQYLTAFAWGFVLLASLAGWGLAITRLLRLRADWGQAIARGIALATVIGGGLNLVRAISVQSLVMWIAVGIVLFIALPRPGRGRRGGQIIGAGFSPVDVMAIAALLVSYSTWICLDAPPNGPPWLSYSLNPSDDYQGYALLPIQMLQTGAMMDDPFNDRRSMSGLGGEPFLQTMALLFLPLPYIHLMDPGISHIAMAVAIYAMGRRRRWPRALPGALVLIYLLVPTEAWNASAISMPGVLLLSLYRTMADERSARGGRVRRAVAIALPFAAVLTLKYTVLPGAVAIVGIGVLARMIAERRFWRPLADGALAGVLTLVMLLPWMIASYRACGTFLYPFLGEGFRRYTTIAIPHKQSNRSPRQIALQIYWIVKSPRMIGCALATFGALLVLARGGCPRRRLAATLAAMSGSIVTLFAFIVVFPMTASYRYSYPFFCILLILSFSVVLDRSRTRPPGHEVPSLLRRFAWLLLVVLALRLTVDLRPIARIALDSVWGGLMDRPFIPPEEAERYRRLQDHIPAGSRALCVGDQNLAIIKPFLFDFSRNVLFVHDIPGCISPPPGIPLSQGGEALAAYLRSQKIRYLILHTERDTPQELMARASEMDGSDNWISSMLANYARLTRILNEYADKNYVIYRDGGYMIMDIGTKPPDDARRGQRASSASGTDRAPVTPEFSRAPGSGPPRHSTAPARARAEATSPRHSPRSATLAR